MEAKHYDEMKKVVETAKALLVKIKLERNIHIRLLSDVKHEVLDLDVALKMYYNVVKTEE